MSKKPFWYLMLAGVLLSLGASPSFAQSSDSGSSSSGSEGTSASGSGASSEGDTSGSDRNCPPGQQWDDRSQACANEGVPNPQ